MYYSFHIMRARLAEWSKAWDLSSHNRKIAWVRTPHLAWVPFANRLQWRNRLAHGTYRQYKELCRGCEFEPHLEQQSFLSREKIFLPDRESNPGLPRDRRRSSPLDYRGIGGWQLWHNSAKKIICNTQNYLSSSIMPTFAYSKQAWPSKGKPMVSRSQNIFRRIRDF